MKIDEAAMERYQGGKRALIYNILINLSLALFKGAAGYFARSQAMIADAFHSGGDVMVNVVVLFGLRSSYKPADECHPYGHGKAETLAQNLVGLLIMGTGGYLIISSALTFREGVVEAPGTFALIAALISLVVKEVLFRYMWKLGQKYNSRALIANAWDHRCDVLSSLAALIGIGGARLGGYLGHPHFYYLDPVAGMVVAVLIIYMGLKLVRESRDELMDGACSGSTLDEISQLALEIPHVKEVYEVRARRSGPCLLVDLEIGVDGNLSIEEGHELAHRVKENLLQKREEIHFVNIHVAPCKE